MPPRLNEVWHDLEVSALGYFEEEGFSLDAVRFWRAADLRYKGQEHTVKVPIGSGPLGPNDLPEIDRRFHDLHEQQYTFRLDVPIEYVNLHLTAFGAVEKPRLARIPEQTGQHRRRAQGGQDGGLRRARAAGSADLRARLARCRGRDRGPRGGRGPCGLDGRPPRPPAPRR